MKKSVLVFVGAFFIFCVANISAQDKTPQIISGGVINGKSINLVKPEYPAAARAVNAGGTVNVEVIVDENGEVTSATAISGHPLLREASKVAAIKSKFARTKIDGKAVKVRGIIVYNFTPGSDKPTDTATNPEAQGAVMNGKALSLPKPEYSSAARAVKAEGAVNVQITIDEEGNVISAKSISGHPLLKQSAEDAAMQSKFPPTKLDDKPIKVTGILVYNFPAATGEKSNVDTISGGVLNGKAVNLVKPKYPEEAKKANAEGTVNVQVTIDENGNVISAKAVSGHELLREASEKAARESKFSPTILSGNAVIVRGVIVYNFTAK